jgi:hypothetical protein
VKQWMTLLALPFLVTPMVALAAETTILDCNFDDKVVGELIGTGGAALHEPVTRDGIPAIVRAQPFASPSLEISEDWGFGARAVRFEFLNDLAITAGMLRMTFDLQFDDLNSFNFYVREKSFSAVSFLDLNFTNDGSINASDLNGLSTSFLGSYTPGTVIPVTLAYNLDALTYDLTIGTNTPIVGESLGPIPQGIGAILIGPGHDADSTGTFHLDNLKVTATQIPEPVTPSTWSRVKSFTRQ